MHNYNIKYKNINKILIYLVFITSIIWPVLQIMINQMLELNSSYYSSISLAIAITYLLINYNKVILNYNNEIIIINSLFIFYVFILSYLHGNFEFAMRGVKTCGAISIYIIFIYFSKEEILNKVKNYNNLLLNLLTMVGIYYIFELIIRIYNPNLFGLYNLAKSAKFTGTSYLQYNDIQGLFSGARPLGMYFDMHTGPGLMLLAIIYCITIDNIKHAIFFSCTLILTFSTSTILIAIPLFYILLKINKNYYIILFFLLGSFFFGHISEKQNSFQAILSDIIYGLDVIYTQNFINILFGTGYNPEGSIILNGNESFFLNMLSFLGIFGILFMIFSNLININLKYDNKFLLKIYILLLIPMLTAHYNNLLNVSSGLLVAIIYFNINRCESEEMS